MNSKVNEVNKFFSYSCLCQFDSVVQQLRVIFHENFCSDGERIRTPEYHRHDTTRPCIYKKKNVITLSR